jgi:hypothetical protein
MKYGYDIYKRLPEERLLWVKRVQDLEAARRLVASLQAVSIDRYVAYDCRERTVASIFGTRETGPSEIAA